MKDNIYIFLDEHVSDLYKYILPTISKSLSKMYNVTEQLK